MRLAHTSATLLMAGSLSLAAWGGPVPPYQLSQVQPVVQVDPALVDAQVRKTEIDIELAWLADPATFPCQLSVHCRGAVLEVSGMVPDERVHQRVLALVQRQCPLAIEDKILVAPGSALPNVPCNRDVLCRTAVTRMAKAFGQYGLSFDVTADATGQIMVAGSIPSYQEKLDVSRRLSQLPGCSAVVNKLEVKPLAKGGRAYTPVTADSQVLLPAGGKPIDVAAQIAAASRTLTPPPAPTPPVVAAPSPAPAPAVAAMPKPPVPASTSNYAPASPYAGRPAPEVVLKANLGNPQPMNEVRANPLAVVQLAPRPQPTPETVRRFVPAMQAQRSGNPLPTAWTPSTQRATGPVAMAGMPSSGPRPASMPRDVLTGAQPLPETGRSFVPSRPPTASAVAPAARVVAANLQQPASTNQSSKVVPTGYQSLPQPMPRGPEQPPASPRPLPSAAIAQPSSPRPLPPVTTGMPVRPKTEAPISPYVGRQPMPERPPASMVQPVSASRPLPFAPRPLPAEMPERVTPPSPAPRTLPTPERTAPAPRPMPTEHLERMPTPEITPDFLSYLKQRIYYVTAGRARAVEIQKVGSDRLKIALKSGTTPEGEQLAAKILGLSELGPYQVDLEIKLGQ